KRMLVTIHQGSIPLSVKNPPVGPEASKVAYFATISAARSTERLPVKPLRSVAVNPGLMALTRKFSPWSSFASSTVNALSAVFDEQYANRLTGANGKSG